MKTTGRKPKAPLYVLPHGIEVIGEYAPSKKNTYWRVRIRPHRFFPIVPVIGGGCYVRRSRVLLAAKLGRALLPSEHAHHRDENQAHDTLDNVELLTATEHNRHHKTGSCHRAKSRAKTSATLKRLYASGEKLPVSLKGSQQACAKLSEAEASLVKRSTEKTKVLAHRYGVSGTTVKQIRNGSIWKHIP